MNNNIVISKSAKNWSDRIFRALQHTGKQPMLIEVEDAKAIMLLLDEIAKRPIESATSNHIYVRI